MSHREARFVRDDMSSTLTVININDNMYFGSIYRAILRLLPFYLCFPNTRVWGGSLAHCKRCKAAEARCQQSKDWAALSRVEGRARSATTFQGVGNISQNLSTQPPNLRTSLASAIPKQLSMEGRDIEILGIRVRA